MPRKKQKTKKEYTLKRWPVVTMLGHVDHGKTSLLDAIRGTKVQECEAGGITQSVRTHQIEFKAKDNNKYKITFIDTPGHKAFTKMRSRGATVTDIVVLVVAADDGVQPQTKEAIKFTKKAKAPIIVALNKIDKKGIDKAKVKRQLSQNGVQIEELGGDVMCVETSAKEKKGLDELLESILLVGELSQLKKMKSTRGHAFAVVLESSVDKSLGPISLCLIKGGSVAIGDYVSWNSSCTRIRSIKGDNFCNIDQASESEAVWLVGFNTLIPVGITLYMSKELREEKKIIAPKKKKVIKKEDQISDESDAEEEEMDQETLSELLSIKKQDTAKPQLSIILKSESQGTLEVAINELEKLSTDEVDLKIIDSSIGEITEDDIQKAMDVNGIVIGFKSKIGNKTEKISRKEKILVKNYDIIYQLLEEVSEVIASLIKPELKEVEVARAIVKKVFELSNKSKVAGCKISKGTIVKGYKCYAQRPTQQDERVGEGKIVSLKHGKEEIREAPKDTECGLLIEPQIDIEKDDEIICFKEEKV